MEEINLRNYAYLGDAVWELFIREKTIHITNTSKILHLMTTNMVKTPTQNEFLHCLEPTLTEEELEIVRRARNLPIPVGRRNIQAEYRQATAFETLIGWWKEHDSSRLDEMFGLLNSQIEEQINM